MRRRRLVLRLEGHVEPVQTIGGELVAERDEMLVELAAAADAGYRGQRTLAEAIRDSMVQQSVVGVHAGSTALAGVPAEANDQLLCLLTGSSTAVIKLSCVSAVRVQPPTTDERAAHSAAPPAQLPASMRALLRELAVTEEVVELAGPALAPLRGRVLAVSGGSHVDFATSDGCEWLVPLASVGWVVRRSG